VLSQLQSSFLPPPPSLSAHSHFRVRAGKVFPLISHFFLGWDKSLLLLKQGSQQERRNTMRNIDTEI